MIGDRGSWQARLRAALRSPIVIFALATIAIVVVLAPIFAIGDLIH
jgi:hypothetical protein